MVECVKNRLKQRCSAATSFTSSASLYTVFDFVHFATIISNKTRHLSYNINYMRRSEFYFGRWTLDITFKVLKNCENINF